MNIVHLTTVHNPRDTRILYRECTSLSRAGHKVELIACGDEDFECNGVLVKALPKSRHRLHRMTVSAWRCLYAALSRRADIYHFHDPELLPWMLVLRLTGATVVFDIHERFLSNIGDRAWIPSFLRPIFNVIGRSLVPIAGKAFHVIFAEDSYADEYPEIRSYTVIHNFPDLRAFAQFVPEPRRSVFTVGYLGSVSEARGILDLLEALQIVQRRGRRIGALIIGRDDRRDQKSLQEMILAMGLEDVEIHQYMPQPRALSKLAACHAGFAVLHNKKNFYDSYPTKVFEYMGCGLPVITSNFPLYESVVIRGNCGMAITPQDSSTLAKIFEQLMDNENGAMTMGENGRRLVHEKYNWEREEAALIKLYDSLGDSTSAQRT